MYPKSYKQSVIQFCKLGGAVILGCYNLVLSYTYAQETELSLSDKYFNLSTGIFNETCVSFESANYKGVFEFEDRGADGFYLILQSGELLQSAPEGGCSDITISESGSFLYNSPEVILAENFQRTDGSTGIRSTGAVYDLNSAAFNQGSSFDVIYKFGGFEAFQF